MVDVERVSQDTSFDSLFERDYARLVRHLSVAAGSREAAEDAVQEAFAEAHVRWRQLARYDDPAGWVRRVALNRIHNRHRGARRLRAVRARLARQPPNDADEYRQWIDRRDVAEAIRHLSVRQREAVALFYLEALSVAETAELMGVSPGSVKTHLHRARQTLSGLLQEGR